MFDVWIRLLYWRFCQVAHACVWGCDFPADDSKRDISRGTTNATELNDYHHVILEKYVI